MFIIPQWASIDEYGHEWSNPYYHQNGTNDWTMQYPYPLSPMGTFFTWAHPSISTWWGGFQFSTYGAWDGNMDGWVYACNRPNGATVVMFAVGHINES